MQIFAFRKLSDVEEYKHTAHTVVWDNAEGTRFLVPSPVENRIMRASALSLGSPGKDTKVAELCKGMSQSEIDSLASYSFDWRSDKSFYVVMGIQTRGLFMNAKGVYTNLANTQRWASIEEMQNCGLTPEALNNFDHTIVKVEITI